MKKPITLLRRDYQQKVVELTNNAGLPAFVMVEVLENILSQLRPLMDSQVQRDEARWRAAVQEENNQTADQNEKE